MPDFMKPEIKKIIKEKKKHHVQYNHSSLPVEMQVGNTSSKARIT